MKAQRLAILLLCIFAAALAVRIVPALAVYWVSPDAVEYLDIARRLAHGEGFTLSIKAYHFIHTPVIHYAGYDRPLLYPAIVGAIWSIWENMYIPQVINVLFASIGAVLATLISYRLYGLRAAALTGLLVALSPPLVRTSLYPWSEATAFLFVMLEVFLLTGEIKKKTFLLAGAAAGLAYLARPTTAWIAIAVVLWMSIGNAQKEKARYISYLIYGAAPFLVLQVLINLAYCAPALTTPQSYIYRAVNFEHGMIYYPPKIEDSVWDVLNIHTYEMLRQIYRHVRDYSTALFIWLGILSLLLPFAIYSAWRKRIGGTLLLPPLLATAGFLFICLSWPSYDKDRFLQLPYVFLLIFIIGETCLLAIERQDRRLRSFLTISVTVMALCYLTPAINLARESIRRHGDFEWPLMGTFSRDWRNPDSMNFFQWIRENTASDDIIAAKNPWAVAYHTHRPAILWPAGIQSLRMDARRPYSFADRYNIAYVVQNRIYRSPQFGPEPEFIAWKYRCTSVGSYRIFQCK